MLRAIAAIGDGGAAADVARNGENAPTAMSARSVRNVPSVAVNARSAALASAAGPKRASSGRKFNRRRRLHVRAAITITGRHRDINR